MKLLSATIAVATIFSMLLSWAESDTNQAKIATESLGNGLYVLTTTDGPYVGNIGVSVGNDGVFLIDDQVSSLGSQIAAAIAVINPENRKIRFIANSHFHYDHTGGNDYWADQGVTIMAHHNVRHRMKKAWSFAAMAKPPRARKALPILTFEKGISLHLNDQTIDIAELPNAHTDGDVVVWFREANVIHVGDVAIPDSFPLFDLNGGGSFEGYLQAVNIILGQIDDQTLVIPGHGSMTNKAAIEGYYQRMLNIHRILKPLAESESSMDAIVASAPLAEYSHMQWSPDFMNVQQFTEIAIRSLREGSDSR